MSKGSRSNSLTGRRIYVGALFSAFFAQVGSCWRSWALCWLILSLLGPFLSSSWSKMAPKWLNIAQHSAKMGQDSLQEQPQDPKKPSKVLYSRRFWGFHQFWQDGAQDPKKVTKMLPKAHHIAYLRLQVGLPGYIFSPSWPT